ncbi:hypothetical protein SAMD00023353_10400210 [Rosellinia necatrix]|uniref:Uncharacterized protein n=1 Tax=Rosellinia necatrix TaxID=77044 RepID=A0A1S8AB38_ROSNE|nr:hypothetical protein SAMD00023353_10400210 [Rosellinia necatrix]
MRRIIIKLTTLVPIPSPSPPLSPSTYHSASAPPGVERADLEQGVTVRDDPGYAGRGAAADKVTV